MIIQTIDRVGGPLTLDLFQNQIGVYGRPISSEIESGYAVDRWYLIARAGNGEPFGIPCDAPASAEPTDSILGSWVLPKTINH